MKVNVEDSHLALKLARNHKQWYCASLPARILSTKENRIGFEDSMNCPFVSLNDYMFIIVEQHLVGSVQHGGFLLEDQRRPTPGDRVSAESTALLSQVSTSALTLQVIEFTECFTSLPDKYLYLHP